MRFRALSSFVALAACFALATACDESPKGPASGSTSTAQTTAVTAAPTAAVSGSASAEPTTAATAEPAPTTSASVSATASATASETAKPKTTATAKASAAPTATPSGDPATPPTAQASAAPSETPSAEPTAPPAPGSADAIALQLDTIFKPKKTFSAKFKQRLEQKVSGQKKESTGNLLLERPNKVSFHYDAPNTNRVVSNGSLLKVYIGEDKQMFESPVNGSEYAAGFGFLVGGGLLSGFTFTFNTKADFKEGYVLIGKPKKPNPNYDMILFYVKKDLLEKSDLGALLRIVIIDAQGNKNRFDFESPTSPDTIDAKEWDFTPPEGTTVKKP